jgi:hypothetical protein
MQCFRTQCIALLHDVTHNIASARISKGQGYQGFLRKRAGSSFGKKGQFASYKEKLEKLTEYHYF